MTTRLLTLLAVFAAACPAWRSPCEARTTKPSRRDGSRPPPARPEPGRPRLALADISPLLAREGAKQSLPAVAAVVIQGAGTVARGVAGKRRRGDPTPAGLADRWHIGSCTKAVTATMLAVLVARGKLAWERTIAQGLPKLAARIRPEYRQVTLEQLLAHRGRIRHEWDVPGLWPKLWRRRDTPVAQRRVLARALLAEPPKVSPGAYAYANAGYAIAGHVAETVTGKPWEQLMRELVFAPLGMRSAGFGVPWKGLPPRNPWPHDARGTPIPPGPLADNPPAIGPGGTMHASLDDWARFVAEHLRGARGEDGSLLPAAAYRRLHRPRPVAGKPFGYALGWKVLRRAWAKGPRPGDSGRCLHHSGSNNSWYALVWIAPERDFAVLTVTNIGGKGVFKRIDAVTWAVIKHHLGRIAGE